MDVPRNWTFETSYCATEFDRHVREQLPWYDLATNAITHIARHYIPMNGLVYDIGSATGNIGKAIKPILDDREATLIGIEPSREMILKDEGNFKVIEIEAENHEYEEFDLAIVFLTLMFVPPSQRKNLIKKLRSKCIEGGAIIVFDKLLPDSGYIQTIMSRLTLAGKISAGVNPKEVIDKELSLGGVQRPICYDQLGGEAFLWFKFGDFAGWIIEKNQSDIVEGFAP
jgi:tRNA (cmo5U34)-methyltransferase